MPADMLHEGQPAAEIGSRFQDDNPPTERSDGRFFGGGDIFPFQRMATVEADVFIGNNRQLLRKKVDIGRGKQAAKTQKNRKQPGRQKRRKQSMPEYNDQSEPGKVCQKQQAQFAAVVIEKGKQRFARRFSHGLNSLIFYKS